MGGGNSASVRSSRLPVEQPLKLVGQRLDLLPEVGGYTSTMMPPGARLGQLTTSGAWNYGSSQRGYVGVGEPARRHCGRRNWPFVWRPGGWTIRGHVAGLPMRERNGPPRVTVKARGNSNARMTQPARR